MNQCKNCGIEFDGKFCPECGTKAEQCKYCPQCNTEVKPNSKYCVECGYSFTDGCSSRSDNSHLNMPKTKIQSTQKIKTIFNALKCAAWALSTLFAVLLFLFYLTPVANIIGDLDENLKPVMVSIGNIYTLCGNTKYGSLAAFSIAIIIVSVAVLAYAAVNSIVFFQSKKLPRYKGKFSFTFLFSCGAVIIYLIFLIISSVLLGQISSADGGMGLIEASACPKLLLAFSIIFIVFQAAIGTLEILLVRKHPKLLAPQTEIQSENASINDYINQANRLYGEYAYKRATDNAEKQRKRYENKTAALKNLPVCEKTDLTEQEQLSALKKINKHVKLSAVCTFFMFAIFLSIATIFGLLFLLKSKWKYDPHKLYTNRRIYIAMIFLSILAYLSSSYCASAMQNMLLFIFFNSAIFFYMVSFVLAIITFRQTSKLALILYGTKKINETSELKIEMGNLYETEKEWVFKKIDEKMIAKQEKIKLKYGITENI